MSRVGGSTQATANDYADFRTKLTAGEFPAGTFVNVIDTGGPAFQVFPGSGTDDSVVRISGNGWHAIRTVISPVDFTWFGAKGDGVFDNSVAWGEAIAHKDAVTIPKGVFFSSTSVVTTAAESDAITITGSGESQTILSFSGTNGVQLLGSAHTIRDLAIIDRDAYTTPVTTLALFHSQLPQRGSITPAKIGLLMNRNWVQADTVSVYGFNAGIKIGNTKFYMLDMHCRASFNETGFVVGDTGGDTPNFSRSISGYFTNNFGKNLDIISGFHTFRDCSFEICADYDVNNANYPLGGIHIQDTSNGGFFDHCYFEEVNIYNFRHETEIHNPANIWNVLTWQPMRVNGIRADASRNLIDPPHKNSWQMAIAASGTVDVTNTHISDDKRFARITANGAVGISKAVNSHGNLAVRGLTPLATANLDFKIYVGFWIRLVTGTFSANFPTWKLLCEDTNGSFFDGNNPARTMIYDSTAFDNTNLVTWQYVGAEFNILSTLATGVALRQIILSINLEDATVDCSSSPRVVDIASPEVRFLMADEGHEVNIDRANDPNESARVLTIASGVVNAVDAYHVIDTEAAAGSDDLDTVTGQDLNPGNIVTLSPASGSRTPTIKDNTGNLKLDGDFAMNNLLDSITLQWSGIAWFELSRSTNT